MMRTDTEQAGFGLAAVSEIWKRRKWIVTLIFFGAFGPLATAVWVLPNLYQSSATVMVERQQVPESFVKSTVTSALESRLQTINQEVLSRSRLEELINRFGLYENLRQSLTADELLERMRSDVRLELRGTGSGRKAQSQSTIAFSVGYRGSDPRKVALVANTLASFFIEENLKVRGKQAAGTAEFLAVQLEEVLKKLTEQEKKLGEFKERYPGELPEQTALNLTTLEKLHDQLRINADRQTLVREKQGLLAHQLGSMAGATNGEPSGKLDPRELQILTLKEKLAELRTQFNDKYPEIVRIKALIASLEQLQAEGAPYPPADKAGQVVVSKDFTTPWRQQVIVASAELTALKREEENLRQAVKVYQQRVENAPRREQEYRALSRDYETTRETYRSLLARQEEARVAESMEERQKGENFRILDPATVAEKPSSPNRPLFVGLGALFALGLAVGIVVLLEQSDDSFHRVETLEAFAALPVLVSIPRILSPADLWWRRLRFGFLAVIALVGVMAVCGASYKGARGNEWLSTMLSRS
jgi:polysaccharide chain length determinant protein (PEP-CTERM system associated)